MLEWNHCTIGYRRDQPIFDQFSLTLDDSAVLVGPRGGGKSTLLAAMMGLVPYCQGTLRVGQRSLGGMPRIGRQSLSYLPATNLAPPEVTVTEYLTELARLDGLPWPIARRHAQQMAARLHLSDVGTFRIRQLSGGMKRRTLLAAAVLKPSEWLLVDQPTAGLDPEEQRTVLDLLQTETETRGVLMITQQMDDVADFRKRTLILDGGQVIFDGSSQALQDTARGHVFRTASASAPGRPRPWPSLRSDASVIKAYQHSAPPGSILLDPVIEDGYFWQLSLKKERDHGE